MKMFLLITLVCSCFLPGGLFTEVVTTRLGGVARLNCSTTTGGSVEWKRILLTESSFTLSYIYVHPWLHKPYDTGGRHNVSLDPLTGACDLVITNVIETDAGKYVCTQTIGREERPVELVVLLVNDPTCRPNTSLANVLVENDCDIDPDYIEFNCSIAYRGNVPPDMQLQMSNIGVLDNVTVSSWVQSNTNYHSVQWVSIARRQMMDERFQCEVRNTMVDVPPSCSSEKVSVMYFYKTNRTRKITYNKDNPADRFVKCTANTSEQCSYRWHKPNHNLFEPSDSIIDLAGQNSCQNIDLHLIVCQAKCKLRGISCVAEPLLLEFSPDKASKINISAIVIPLVLLVVIIIVLALLWKYRRELTKRNCINDVFTRCRRTQGATAKPGSGQHGEIVLSLDSGFRENWRTKLVHNRSRLVSELHVSTPLLVELLVKDVISEEDREIIQSKSTQFEKVDCLIDILQRRGDKRGEVFRDILRDHNPDLADLLTDHSTIEVDNRPGYVRFSTR
jgi:hypothetical protein